MLSLSKKMLQDSVVYVVNGLLMVLTFFMCRVLMFPLLYCWYGATMGLAPAATLAAIPLWCHLGSLALWLPQLVWFTKIARGSAKLVREKIQ